MSVEIAFPVEFIVEGVPLSLAASAQSREAWKACVVTAARSALQEGYWLTAEPVAVTILNFPRTTMTGDLDNIAKPILDALSGVAYIDDHQVERIVLQKFEPERTIPFANPTPCLADALERVVPLVYIRIDNDVSREV